MERLILNLKGDSNQEAQLAQLVAQQNDPKSPLYHKFLSPQEFASQFGVAAADIEKVAAWLRSHGFTIEETPAGNRSIIFSGTTGQVARAFNTEIRSFNIAGEQHLANVSDPQIPAALADVVGGVVKLHDFRHSHNIAKSSPITPAQLANPQYTNGSSHYLSPADYATIYNINPLYESGSYGRKQTIAVIARSNINSSDVSSFQTMFGLLPNPPQIVLVNTDPGVLGGDSTETTLDTEWSGAIAPYALIKVIVAASGTSDGIDLASSYAVSHNAAPIISLSYGSCEASMGASELAFYNSLWQQAAAQGQSVVVSSGDSGAAGCASGSSSSGSGKGINGLCSSPYATCVGGTEFVEGSNPAAFWLPGNNSVYGSAISYIPETVWNESGSNGGSGLWAGGGGASITYAKPAWQAGLGVPADSKRDVPDVAMAAAGHDGYLIIQNGGVYLIGGTSAAAPSFAGIIALLQETNGTSQGLLNPNLYSLATKQRAGGAPIFHDITTGNNSVPGVTGFSAAVGYDLASGLGSVDAFQLVNHWTDNSFYLLINSPSTSLSAVAGQTAQTTITSTISSTFKSAVTFSVANLPAGATATFAPATIASPGAGSVTLSIATTSALQPGTYPFSVSAAGVGDAARMSLSLVVTGPTLIMTASKTSASLTPGSSTQVTLTTATKAGFNSAVTFSIAGLPTGATSSFAPATIAAPGSGSVALNIAATSVVKAGTYPLTVTATGGGQTASAPLSLVVTVPTFTISASKTSASLTPATSAQVTITTAPQTGFNSAVTFSIAGLPTGATSTFAPATIAAPGFGSVALNIAATPAVKAGTYPLTVTATSGGQTETTSLSLVITVPTFTMSASKASVTLAAGSSAQVTVTTTPQTGFNSAVTLAVTGIPNNVTALFATKTVGAPGAGSVALTIASTTSLLPGTYPLTITGTGGGDTVTASVSIVVPTFSLSASATSITGKVGNTVTVGLTTTPQAGFISLIGFSVSGLPKGVTASFAPVALPGTATGTTTLSLNVSPTAVLGTYPLVINATGGAIVQTSQLQLAVIPQGSCTLGMTLPNGATSVYLAAGQTTTVQASCTSIQGTLSGPLTVSVTSAPTGVTVKPGSLSAGGSTSIQLTAASTMKATSFSLGLTASGEGFSATTQIPVIVTAAGFMLTPAQSALTVNTGTTTPINVTSVHVGSFNSPVTLSWSLPTGITGSFSKSVIAAPGDGSVTANLTVANNATPGMYTAILTGASGSSAVSIPVVLTIVAAKDFSFTLNESSITIGQGQSGAVIVSTGNYAGGFNSTITLSVQVGNAGILYLFESPATSNNIVNVPLQLEPSSRMSPGTYPITITATGGGITHSSVLQVTVTN